MLFGKKRKWMAGHTPMNTTELTETEFYKRFGKSENKTKKSVKFETFIKEEYTEISDNPMKKFYYVRVYDKGHLIDEVKFSNAADAQNYIQKTELFYSNLV